MNAPAFENLDLACAKVGKDISQKPSKELENLITNALAVLEEQGLYALFLFLRTRGRDGAKQIIQKLYKFLKETPTQSPLLSGNDDDVLPSLQQLAKDNLDKLLVARDLIRQTLVYARYHARVVTQTSEE